MLNIQQNVNSNLNMMALRSSKLYFAAFLSLRYSILINIYLVLQLITPLPLHCLLPRLISSMFLTQEHIPSNNVFSSELLTNLFQLFTLPQIPGHVNHGLKYNLFVYVVMCCSQLYFNTVNFKTLVFEIHGGYL